MLNFSDSAMLIVFVAFKDEIYQSDLVLRVVVGFLYTFCSRYLAKQKHNSTLLKILANVSSA